MLVRSQLSPPFQRKDLTMDDFDYEYPDWLDNANRPNLEEQPEQ